MLKNLTLEMSFKPFKINEDEYIKGKIRKAFEDYRPLADLYESVSVLFWLADGSEILDYKGDLEEKVEWGKYIGGANKPSVEMKPYDPNGIGLHSRCYDYIKNPPEFTYGDVKKIVGFVKEIGKEVYGADKKIRVGETFDPGPEFAKSDFKYKKHPEICAGYTMGLNTFVYCASILHEDKCSYAGYPDGIPEGTPFGEFLGRQSQHFLTDMGFDYLWLSNGIGFGLENWSTTGAVFDGENFNEEGIERVSETILEFWRLFRKECPDFRIETRGTNMTVGIDMSTDGVPIKKLYDGGFNLLPPPNSPWAALDGDFGLELAGYMSRIANLPENEEFLFRYYIHDPWWVNSPWYDRYEGQPHDIYMPMAIARMNAEGKVCTPTHMNFLSIDNSYGDMPESCVREPMVHLLKGIKDFPDAPSPVMWVYPFDEYNGCDTAEKAKEMFFGDWFIRSAINNGFPLTGVVSTNNFVSGKEKSKDLYMGSVLLCTIPEKGSKYEKSIIEHINSGGKVLFYGSVNNASEKMLDVIGVEVVSDGVCGELDIETEIKDTYKTGKDTNKIMHRPLVCDGNVNTKLKSGAKHKVIAKVGGFDVATVSDNVCWVRGTNSNKYVKGKRLLEQDDENIYFRGDSILRLALSYLGIDIRFEKYERGIRSNVIMLSRCNNGYIFSTYAPNTTVKVKMKFEQGAPLLMGYETVLEDGYATYNLPRAEHRECHVFVEQESGVVSCTEHTPVSYQMRRRMLIKGLENATVRIYGEEYCKENLDICVNGLNDWYFVSQPYDGEYKTDYSGTYMEIKNVTGEISVAMPRIKFE